MVKLTLIINDSFIAVNRILVINCWESLVCNRFEK